MANITKKKERKQKRLLGRSSARLLYCGSGPRMERKKNRCPLVGDIATVDLVAYMATMQRSDSQNESEAYAIPLEGTCDAQLKTCYEKGIFIRWPKAGTLEVNRTYFPNRSLDASSSRVFPRPGFHPVGRGFLLN